MIFEREVTIFKPSAIDTAISTVESNITQTANTIRSEVSATYATKAMAQSIIEQTAEQIALKVSVDDLVDTMNSQLLITGNTIELTTGHFTIDATNIKVTSEGALTVTGTVNATSGTIGSSNPWHIGGDSSRAWIYSGNKSSMSSTQNGIYIGTDGIEVRVNGSSAVTNSWTKIIGGVTETTQLKIYDGGGTRYGTMVISDNTTDLPSGRNDYFRIGFTNGIVTGASGEDRGGNIFLNRSWCYNNFYARRDVTFGDNDAPGSSSYGRFYLYQNGTYYASWSYGSDRRLKKNISPIDAEKARQFVMALKPSEYQFIKNKDGKWHHGFIAQEVEPVGWDGLVEYDEQNDNMMSLVYTEFIADIIATVQLQQQEINELKGVLNG